MQRGLVEHHTRWHVLHLPVALRQRLAEKRRLLAPLLGLVQQTVGHGLQAVFDQVFNLAVIHQQTHAAGMQARHRVQLQLFDGVAAYVFQPGFVLRVQFNRDGGLAVHVNFIQTALHQPFNRLTRQSQLGQHQLFTDVQCQSLHGFKQGLRVAAERREFVVELLQQLQLILQAGAQFGFLFFQGLLQLRLRFSAGLRHASLVSLGLALRHALFHAVLQTGVHAVGVATGISLVACRCQCSRVNHFGIVAHGPGI